MQCKEDPYLARKCPESRISSRSQRKVRKCEEVLFQSHWLTSPPLRGGDETRAKHDSRTSDYSSQNKRPDSLEYELIVEIAAYQAPY